jgi:hypothetical protein
MKWTRVTPGVYTSGPYRIERATFHRPIWEAYGPGIATGMDAFESKGHAQRVCGEAAAKRAADPATKPVIGDAVTVGGRHGHVGSIQPGNGIETLYCIRFARGKRLCLFRHEFEVIVP